MPTSLFVLVLATLLCRCCYCYSVGTAAIILSCYWYFAADTKSFRCGWIDNSTANTWEYFLASPWVESINLGWILYPRKLLRSPILVGYQWDNTLSTHSPRDQGTLVELLSWDNASSTASRSCHRGCSSEIESGKPSYSWEREIGKPGCSSGCSWGEGPDHDPVDWGGEGPEWGRSPGHVRAYYVYVREDKSRPSVDACLLCDWNE